MKYARTSFAAALLAVAAPLFSQEVKPLRVLTLEPTPTIVKTNDEIRVTYRVEFLDLTESNNLEIKVYEDAVQPQSLNLGDFEATALEVIKRKDGDEYVWDFNYTLRLINKKKGFYKIPKFKFLWTLKKAGEELDGSQRVEESETAEITIFYVTTIVPRPNLDIRDEINLPEYKWRSRILTAAPFAVGLAGFSWVAAGFAGLRFGRRTKAAAKAPDAREEEWRDERPSKWQARRNYKKTILELKNVVPYFDQALEDGATVENSAIRLNITKLTNAVHDIILSETDLITAAHTPSEICAIVGRMKASRKKEALTHLADFLRRYADYLYGVNSYFNQNWGLGRELEVVEHSRKGLSWRGRLKDFFLKFTQWRPRWKRLR